MSRLILDLPRAQQDDLLSSGLLKEQISILDRILISLDRKWPGFDKDSKSFEVDYRTLDLANKDLKFYFGFNNAFLAKALEKINLFAASLLYFSKPRKDKIELNLRFEFLKTQSDIQISLLKHAMHHFNSSQNRLLSMPQYV